MPIYEFECEGCGGRFEELVSSPAGDVACPTCGSKQTQRLISQVSPPSQQPRGPKVRANESQRGERELARRDRIAETRRKRAAGDLPPPSAPKGAK